MSPRRASSRAWRTGDGESAASESPTGVSSPRWRDRVGRQAAETVDGKSPERVASGETAGRLTTAELPLFGACRLRGDCGDWRCSLYD
jgi:hypothetical protein